MKDIKLTINTEEIRQRLYQSIQGDNAKLIVDAIINTCEDEDDALSAVFLASVGIKPVDPAWEIGTKVLVEPKKLNDWSFNKEEMEMVERIKISKSFADVEEIAVDVHAYVKKNEQPKPQDKRPEETADQPNNSEGSEGSQYQDSDDQEDREESESESEGDSDTKESNSGEQPNETGQDDQEDGGETDKDGDSNDNEV